MTSQLAVSTYYGLIKLLRACAGGSPAVAETLHQARISGTIRRLISRCASLLRRLRGEGDVPIVFEPFSPTLSCAMLPSPESPVLARNGWQG